MNHEAARQRIRETVEGCEVVDTHDHLRPIHMLRDSIGVSTLFRASSLRRNMRSADGSPNGLGSPLEISLDNDTWETVEYVVKRVRFTSYYRWLMRGVRELYGLPNGELTATEWEYLSSELRRRYQHDTWLTEVLDRSRIRTVVWDPSWKAGTWESPDPRFFPSLRMNSSLVAYNTDASDFNGSNVIRDWSAHFRITVDSLADLEELIERLIEANVRAGCRSLKSAIAYDRSLAVNAAPRAEAARIFGTNEEAISPADRKLFGDYIVRLFLDRARARGLVVQVHTGLAQMSGSNPMLVEPLLQEYPDVIFDLFHGGYPWIRESAALAQNYPNVRLNLTWLPQLSTEAAVAALKEWLQIVPQIDRISWGADCNTVEEAYGALLAARYVVTRTLTELVEDDELDLESALLAAKSVMSGGGERIYGG